MRPAPVIQIAGALNLAEARMIANAGADLLGLPLRLLDGREDISETEAAEMTRMLADSHPSCEVVAITYLSRAEEVLDLVERIGCRWVQLHGDIRAKEAADLKKRRPDLRMIKALVVRAENREALFAEAAAFAPLVDAFLTDTFDPATGRRGATGQTHDWAVSRELVERLAAPVILAGGLHEGNVAEAVHTVRPAGVDAHTGLELPDGRKCPERVAAFIAHARAALAELAAAR
ncbi:MAG: phosphoribosylanthranilate isomerase [Verrucomicrobiota bacterium]